MDGVLVDWDKGFREKWGKRSEICRSQSYAMEECVFGADDVDTGAWSDLYEQVCLFASVSPFAVHPPYWCIYVYCRYCVLVTSSVYGYHTSHTGSVSIPQ